MLLLTELAASRVNFRHITSETTVISRFIVTWELLMRLLVGKLCPEHFERMRAFGLPECDTVARGELAVRLNASAAHKKDRPELDSDRKKE